jgi:hypothetical protein
MTGGELICWLASGGVLWWLLSRRGGKATEPMATWRSVAVMCGLTDLKEESDGTLEGHREGLRVRFNWLRRAQPKEV